MESKTYFITTHRNLLLALGLLVFVFIGCSKDDDHIEPEEDDPIGTVYYENSFDAMVWGGDYITRTEGIRGFYRQDPNQDNLRVIDESREPEEVTFGTDGSFEFFGMMAPSYRALRGIDGWDGDMVYERPGYIKVGTQNSRHAYVMTPALSSISSGPVNVEVSFKMARWATATDEVGIEVFGGGEPSVTFVDGTSPDSWTEKSFRVEGATRTTRILFVTNPNMDGRFFLDDLVISRVE